MHQTQRSQHYFYTAHTGDIYSLFSHLSSNEAVLPTKATLKEDQWLIRGLTRTVASTSFLAASKACLSSADYEGFCSSSLPFLAVYQIRSTLI